MGNYAVNRDNEMMGGLKDRMSNFRSGENLISEIGQSGEGANAGWNPNMMREPLLKAMGNPALISAPMSSPISDITSQPEVSIPSYDRPSRGLSGPFIAPRLDNPPPPLIQARSGFGSPARREFEGTSSRKPGLGGARRPKRNRAFQTAPKSMPMF